MNSRTLFRAVMSLSSLIWVAGFGVGAYFFFQDGENIAGAAFVLSAIAFPLIDVILFRRRLPKPMSVEQIATLKSTGQKIQTTFKALDRHWNISVNGQSPIVVFTQDQQGRVYQGEDLWFSGGDVESYTDPRFTAWQKLEKADPMKTYTIPVYVNPQKPNEYFMDLSAMR